MSDDNEDLDDTPVKGDNSRVHRRIGRLSSENKQLAASLADANAKMADLQKMVEKAGALGKDFEKLTAERDGLLQAQSGWADERAIMGAGVSDEEGISFVKMAWAALGDAKPEGGLGEWLKSEDLPRGVKAYLEPESGNVSTSTPRQPNPNAGTVPMPATGNGIAMGDISRMSPKEWAARRESVWGQLGVSPPSTGKKD